MATKHSQNSLWAFIAWATAALFYAYHQIIISAIALMPEILMNKYSITMYQYGLISIFYTIAYAIMMIPVGIMLDNYALKKIMTLALLIFSAACAVLAFTTSYKIILVTRFIMGGAASFSVLGSFKLAAEWFSANWFASLAGATVSLGYFGSILGNRPFLNLLQTYNYEQIFLALSFFGLGLSLISLIFISNFNDIQEKKLKFSDVYSQLKLVLQNRLSMVLIFYGMLVFAPLLVFKDSLGILFFTNYYGYSKTVACHMMSTTLFASIIGAPLLGAISDRMQRRRPVLILTPIIILITLVLMMLNINTGNEFFNQVITTALTFSFGFMTWGFLLCYTVFKEINPPHILSIGLGLMNSINMIGGILSVPFITYLIDKLPEHYPLMQNSELYFYAFLILPIIILMSFPLLKDIPETGCRQVE